jgi:hypothetical protein
MRRIQVKQELISTYIAATASKTLRIIILFQARISIDLIIDVFWLYISSY